MVDLVVAVADLARFCHRRGDIDYRFSPSPTGEQGIEGHQRLYRRRPPGYRSEYPVEHCHRRGDISLVLRGRADGYDAQAGYVEEIKTCRVDPSSIPEAVSRSHLAQARLYAALIARQEALDALEVRLTWFNIDTGQEISLEQPCSREELEAFLADSLSRFSDWIARLARLRRSRDDTLASLTFPHGEFRRGQRDLAELTYKCIDQGGQLLLEAPTGIGKTAAVLFPALKALATGKHEKLVFVTAKTVGRLAAEETLDLFSDSGFCGSALSLTARDRVCLSPGSACHGDECPYARGYYDKLPRAMAEAIERPRLWREDLESLARQFEVCPYQLSLDLLPWVDVVIADIHYVYSLQATLGSLMDSSGQRWSVLLDEAHNLPERARGMYSARLAKASLMAAREASSGPVRRRLDKINRQMLALQNESWQEPQFDSRDQVPERLLAAMQDLTAMVSEQLAADPAYLQRHTAFLEFYFDVLQLLRVAENWGDDYRFELSRGGGRQSLCIELNCLDPGRLLAVGHGRAHAVTAFSATLSPMQWCSASLGFGENAVFRRADSPFSPDQLEVDIVTRIDTRFHQRQASLPALAGTLLTWLSATPGNCILYFPSYRYMSDCLAAMSDAGGAIAQRHVLQQEPGLDEAGRQALLSKLEERRDIAAFCILGGVFGEGIDLPGDRLASIVVVGVGMPQVNRQTRQLQQWYQHRYGDGFEYAYLYPGMQKVDQALGRVVRRLQDRGRALLVDPRYSRAQYRELLPPWWKYRVRDG